MKKILIVVLCIVIAIVSCIGGMVLSSLGKPSEDAYPDSLKQVASVEEIRSELSAFADLPVLDLTKIGASELSYLVRMSNETSSAKPEGYEIVGTREVAGATVRYRLICLGEALEYISADEMPYRGIPLEVGYMQQTEDCARQAWCLTFPLKGYSFRMWASYNVAGLSLEAVDALYNDTYYDLLGAAETIIDTALDQ